MKKIMSLLFGISLTAALYAGTIVKPNTYTAGTIIDPSQVNANDDTIYSEFNGNIENVNVKSNAAIVASKLNLSSIAQDITVAVTATPLTLNNNTATGPIFQVLDNGTTVFMVDDGGEVLIGTNAVDGLVHLVSGTGAGTVSAISDADDLVIEGSANTGISILTPNNIVGLLAFGDVDDADIGGLSYNHVTDSMTMTVNTAIVMTLDADGDVGIGTINPSPATGSDNVLEIAGASSPSLAINDTGQAEKYGISAVSDDLRFTFAATDLLALQNDGKVGIGTIIPDGKLHVLDGSAGSITANTALDQLVLESAVDGGLSILTPNDEDGFMAFGDEDDNLVAGFQYQHGSDAFTMFSDTGTVFKVETGLQFQLQPVGAADAELEVSDGTTQGAGTIHAANYDAHSSRSMKSDIRDLTQSELIQARNDVKNLKHVEFRFKTMNKETEQYEDNPTGHLYKGLIFEEAPESIHGRYPGTLSLGNRILNLEITVQYLIDENNKLKDRVDVLEALQP